MQKYKLVNITIIQSVSKRLLKMSTTKLIQSDIQEKTQTKYKSYNMILAIIFNACLSSSYFGYCLGYFNSINFNDIVKIYSLESFQRSVAQGLYTGQIMLGAGIGALSSKLFINKLSRRQFFLSVNAVIAVSVIFLQIADYRILAIFRFIQGLALGCLSTMVPLYVKQIAPTDISGPLGTLNQTFITAALFGIYILTFVLSMFMPAEAYWRIIFIIPLFMVIFQSFVFIKIYNIQSPKYWLLKGQVQQARKVIAFLYKEQYVEQILAEKIKDLSSLQTKVQNLKNIELKQFSIEKVDKDEQKQIQSQKQFKQQNVSNNKLAVFAAIHLSILQQMVGISAIIAYGSQITLLTFPILQKILPIFIHFEALAASFVAMSLLKQYGRVQVIQFGCIGIATSNIIVAAAFYFGADENNKIVFGGLSAFIIIISVLVIRGFFGLSLGPVTWMYIPEIVQPNIVPYSTMANYASCTINMISFPIINKFLLNNNPAGLFLYFGLYTSLSFVINRYCLVETKDKTEYQIRKQYESKYSNKNQ